MEDRITGSVFSSSKSRGVFNRLCNKALEAFFPPTIGLERSPR